MESFKNRIFLINVPYFGYTHKLMALDEKNKDIPNKYKNLIRSMNYNYMLYLGEENIIRLR